MRVMVSTVIPDWLELSWLLRLLIISIIVMKEKKVLFGVVVMILPLVLVVMSDFALGAVMIILFYKIK